MIGDGDGDGIGDGDEGLIRSGDTMHGDIDGST